MKKTYRTKGNIGKVPEIAKNRVLSLFPKGSKAQFGLIAIGVIAILILGLIFGFTVFLAFNIFTIAGAFLIVIGGIAFLKGIINQFTMAMVVIGVILIILPFTFKFLGGFTLATFLG